MQHGVQWEMDFSGIKQKLSAANLERSRFVMANQMLADMNNYVPLEGSALRNSRSINAAGDELTWRTVYALAQFYGSRPLRRGMPITVFMHNYTTSGTGKRWDLAAKKEHMADWTQAYLKGGGFR